MAATGKKDAPSRRATSLEALAARLVGRSLAEVERAVIIATVASARTERQAADSLGIHPKTLRNKLRKFQEERPT